MVPTTMPFLRSDPSVEKANAYALLSRTSMKRQTAGSLGRENYEVAFAASKWPSDNI